LKKAGKMSPHLGLQRILIPGSQASDLTTGVIKSAGGKNSVTLSLTAVSGATMYGGALPRPITGIIQVSASASTQCHVDLYKGTTLLSSIVIGTANTTATTNLTEYADKVQYWTLSGAPSNVVITVTNNINIAAVSAGSATTGTLDTITSTSTYTTTGAAAYALVVGGGGGGFANNDQSGCCGRGGGGGGGGLAGGRITLNGNLSVTVGNAGNSGKATSNAGGTSSISGAGFTTITANGGGGAGDCVGGTPGTPGGSWGGACGQSGAYVNDASITPSLYRWIKSGTTGAGAGVGGNTIGGNGGGDTNIGRGGNGAGVNTGCCSGNAGSGYGAGGGGGTNGNGGAGTQGVVYILRF
jgi:hypothetical protein